MTYVLSMTKLLIPFMLATGALYLLPTEASAQAYQTGYPCSVMHYNYPGLGSDGGIFVSVYDQPNCNGSYVASVYVCSPGSTSYSCTYATPYLYDKPQLMGLFDALIESAHRGFEVSFPQGYQCSGGTAYCASTLRFWGQ